MERRLAGFSFVRDVESPRAHGASLVSADRRSTLVQFEIVGDSTTARERVEPVLAAISRSQAAHPEFTIEEFGDASASRAISKAFEEDARQAEFLSLPLTLLILVAAFGTLVAAGLPLLLGLTAVAATVGLLGPVSHLIPIADAVASVVLLVGLAVGVDYSMFYIRRERDERAAGRSRRAALEVAAATSGRAVLISGLTVMVAMSGMFVVAHPVFESFAIGTIMVVAVAMVGSITVVPATLAMLGDRIDKGRLPFTRRRGRDRRIGRLGGDHPAGPALAVARRRHGDGGAGRARSPDPAPAHRRPRRAGASSRSAGDAHLRPHPSARSRAARCPPSIAVRIPRGEALSVTVALKELRERALATGLLKRSVRLLDQRRADGRGDHHGGGRQRHRRHVGPCARRVAR